MAEPLDDKTALGIDLGTTMSVVAQVNSAGLPVVLPNAEGSPTTPSIVLFDSGHAVVGAVARESLATEPASVVQLVKRHIGSGWTFDYSGVAYRPEHVSALILRKVVHDAQLLAGPVTQAAITVPAYFSDPMRAATLRAGELAGLEVLGLLSEPTAAALAYGYDRRPAGATGVVVDLGGGTFDVTVMEYDGAELKVRATGGDAYLGGANFDKVLFDASSSGSSPRTAWTSTTRTRCRSTSAPRSRRTGCCAPRGPSTTSPPATGPASRCKPQD